MRVGTEVGGTLTDLVAVDGGGYGPPEKRSATVRRTDHMEGYVTAA